MIKEMLGLDLDGTIYDWNQVAYDILVREMGETRSFLEFWRDRSIDKGYTETLWRNLVEDVTTYDKWIPDPRLPKMVRELSKEFNIAYITHRPKTSEFVTRTWLNRFEFPHTDNLLVSQRPKSETIRTMDCVYYVEDKAEILDSIKHVTNTIGIRQPWNEHYRHDDIYFIDSIFDLPRALEELR